MKMISIKSPQMGRTNSKIFNLTILFLLFQILATNGTEPTCFKSMDTVHCKSIKITPFLEPDVNENNLKKFLLSQVDSNYIHQIKSLEIIQSSIPLLNLNTFDLFTSLETLVVSWSKVENVEGSLSPSIQFLNMSFNNLMSLNDSVFQFYPNQKQIHDQKQGLTLDLSYNRLTVLPHNTFLIKLKYLRLKGNKFNCTWINNELYKWYSAGNQLSLEEPDETVCFLNEAAFGNITFLGALKVKASAVEECNMVTKTNPGCKCDIRTIFSLNKLPRVEYPVTHFNKYGKVSYSLRMSCSNQDLERLPKISPFVMELNVTNNSITDLSPLSNDPNYTNLIGLDASDNQISSLEFLSGSTFFDHFQYLLMNGNNITEMHDYDIVEFFAQNRSGLELIYLGDNTISCDCYTVTKLRPTLIKYKSVIKDWKTIFCISPNISIWNLKETDVCVRDESSPIELHWYIIILLEVLLILFVVTKVWMDQRKFRRSGQLPLCSIWIPRLPCDFMLEGLKDTHPKTHTQVHSKV